MATIRREIRIAAAPAAVWDAVREFGAVHTRLAPGFVVDTKVEEGPARVVTFANGLVARELIVTVDDEARRLVYSIVGGAPTHHNASFQVLADGAGGAHLIWLADLLPDSVAPRVAAMMDQGAKVMQEALRASG
jgi:carbon monoxide dehydrogenase subunit G